MYPVGQRKFFFLFLLLNFGLMLKETKRQSNQYFPVPPSHPFVNDDEESGQCVNVIGHTPLHKGEWMLVVYVCARVRFLIYCISYVKLGSTFLLHIWRDVYPMVSIVQVCYLRNVFVATENDVNKQNYFSFMSDLTVDLQSLHFCSRVEKTTLSWKYLSSGTIQNAINDVVHGALFILFNRVWIHMNWMTIRSGKERFRRVKRRIQL